ncbi:cell division protein ZipA [Aliivibrio fischeri]|nr:cell division protein ZipA [Aliivibrio fischeri]MUL12273.1 cell division protein ZipA [Aliivibrio fischeri]
MIVDISFLIFNLRESSIKQKSRELTMQELRLVLILVGALAIAALLFHGLWTSRKETSSKFGKKVDIDFDSDVDDEQAAPMRGFDQPKEDVIVQKERKEPAFAREEVPTSDDPLFEGTVSSESNKFTEQEKPTVQQAQPQPVVQQVQEPTVGRIEPEAKSVAAPVKREEPTISFSAIDDEVLTQPESMQAKVDIPETSTYLEPEIIIEEPEPEPEPEEDVIVINVHGMGSDRFSGNRLFNSLEQNGLVFGDMAIYHRHSDLSGAGKVLFSVANMVSPGHFQVPEGEEFSTPGISFFLPLPCYGDAEHNFKLMLQTAQMVSSELGGNVLDEKRDMLTPNKIDEYKQRVKVFCRK